MGSMQDGSPASEACAPWWRVPEASTQRLRGLVGLCAHTQASQAAAFKAWLVRPCPSLPLGARSGTTRSSGAWLELVTPGSLRGSLRHLHREL